MKPETMLLWAEHAKMRTFHQVIAKTLKLWDPWSNIATPDTPVITGTAGNGPRNTGMFPTQVGQGGINTTVQFSNQGGLSNQGYILPPVYQYPQQFMMNPGSPVLNNQYQNTPGVINNDILVTIQTSLESMHKKLGQLDTIQSSV